MEYILPVFISFLLVFLSELGDKTQLIAMSFSSKIKTYKVLLGVAFGSLLSHGVAIIFGSALGNIDNQNLKNMLNIFTNIIFIVMGAIILLKKEENEKEAILKKDLGISYILMIAFSIAIGEFGDKTFLASIGLGITYPRYKISLVIGAVLGMIISDYIAIILGKILRKRVSNNIVKKLSGILFLIFGILGMVKLILKRNINIYKSLFP